MKTATLILLVILALACVCSSTAALAAAPEVIPLGSLSTGAEVSAVQSPAGQWGIRIESPGMASVSQAQPVRLEVYENASKIIQVAVGYKSLEKAEGGFVGRAEVSPLNGVTFQVEDRWTVSGQVLSICRRLAVSGNAPGGFLSKINFTTQGKLSFPDLEYFVPGVIYGAPGQVLDRAPGGMLNYQAGDIELREDCLTIPVVGAYFRDGSSLAVLDVHPQGDTTAEETQDLENRTLVDERYLFGAMGASEKPHEGVELGFWLPGSVSWMSSGPYGRPLREWRRRYHPIKDGLTQQYEVALRFGCDETFHDFYKKTWRWGWQTMKPRANYYNMDVVRRAITDMLADRVLTVDGRSGIPFFADALTGRLGGLSRDSDAIMGFVGKNLEAAALLLEDADRDSTPRSQNHRKLALAIIDTFVRTVKVDPPSGEGFNLYSGEPSLTNPAHNFVTCCNGQVYIRCLTDDLTWTLKAYAREKSQGQEHPEWLYWCWRFGDWLLTQQRADGSFPRSWHPGTGEVYNPSSTSGYNALQFLVTLDKVTAQHRYVQPALRAGDFYWLTYGSRDQYIGGTPDNPDIMDKEAGTLSLRGYLALYEATQDPKWLRRAQAAAEYAETWIYAWDVPMAADEDDSALGWKKGVSTVGVSRINSTDSAVDQWMSGDVEEYAELYTLTKDTHYLDVARILLHNTKNMLALPGRTYDLLGPGWQQEHWGISTMRGFGAHRGWLPWVTVNHLEGIIALEDFDPALFRRLASKE